MNFELSLLPERTNKPRNHGITMVMDKGLGLKETEDFIQGQGPFTDLVKLGFGSSIITPFLNEKLAIYRNAGIPVYFGGTLLEAFVIRKEFENYVRVIERYKLEYAEVSDGSVIMDHDQKCSLIEQLGKYVTVISEVGSKEEGIIIRPARWIEMMQKELQAGAWKVIAEARESGTVGIYRPNGKA
ncbi:MAG: phosphosulfolactate synthase, partial [Bacteroidota bacterium]